LTEKIETVDAAELEALERRARQRDSATSKAGSTPARLARPENPAGNGEKPVAPAGAKIEAPIPQLFAEPGAVPPGTKVPDPTLTPVWKVGADGKLEALVEASAVDARLAALEAALTHMRLMQRHTMLLVMVMADRLKVSTGEYDAARAIADKVDSEAK